MKIKLWMIIAILLFVSVIIVLLVLPGSSSDVILDETTGVNYDKLDEVVFDVRTEPVRKSDLLLYINANGIIRAFEELELTANISGIINSLNIYEGKEVKKGDLLIGLDDREYEIALNDAIARVTDAKVEYGFLVREFSNDTTVNPKALEYLDQLNKLEKDFSEGKIDELKYNNLKNELDMKLIFTGAKREEVIQSKSGLTGAINAYKRAKLNYEYTKINSPFNGIIGDFDLVIGQRINAGQKLCKLFNNSTLKIDIGVLENDVTKISIGSSAKVEIPSLTGEIFKGRVINISPYVDKETKTCKVTVQLQNISKKLKPGMFVKVMLETDNLRNRTLIPKEALLVRDKRTLVFVVENDLAKWKYVQIGEQNDQFIEITEGVIPGEEVIVEGHYTLAHDAKVKVIK
ncbi:MAG: efflux RND transporter periplasmic adaptor subunit [Melioribacteraceae bacterium]|nr:efflux RND transporter periplasmic adaptor subunit [Melioribacteraceae bacterium]